MSNKKETTILVLSLLATLGLLGIGFLIFQSPIFRQSQANNNLVQSPNSNSQSPQQETGNKQLSVTQRISFGEKSLLPGEMKPGKQAGITAIANGNFERAIVELGAARKNHKNDPETLIFLNNARIATEKSHQIVVMAPLGNNNVNIGLELLRGLAQAQNEINENGGIKGIKLKVGIANDDDNSDISEQIASHLVKTREILGVVGPYSSGNTLAAGKIFDQGELVAISPTSTSVKITNFSPYIFRTVPSDFVAARSLANYGVQKQQKQKIAVFFNSQSQYSLSLKSEFVSSVALEGGQITSEIDVSQANFSAAKSFEQIQQQGAEAIMFATDSGSLDKALQVIQINQKKLTILGGDDNYALKTLEIGRDQAVGMVVAIPWHIEANSQSSYPQTSRQLWGGDVSWRTTLAYDATMALAKAIEGDPNRSGVQKVLRSGDFSVPGAANNIRFLPSGDRNSNIQLVEIQPKSPSRSGTGYDFVPLPAN